MRWADLLPPGDPAKVAVLVVEDHGMAEHWCRVNGRARPGRPGAPIVVTSVGTLHRLRGMRFTPDEQLKVLGHPRGDIVDIAHDLFARAVFA